MKMMEWLRNLKSRIMTKKIEAPKEEERQSGQDVNWKETINYPDVNNEEALRKITQEQKRIDQIKIARPSILFRTDNLTKEDISDSIEKYYQNIALEDVDIQSLMAIHGSIRYESTQQENNVRDFISSDDDNIVSLVDKLVEKAKKEAEAYQSTEPSKFVNGSDSTIKKLMKQIDQEKNHGIESAE